MDEMKNEGLQPDVFCYTALIRDFYKLGQIDEIKSLFQERLSCNVQPNKITYAVVIDGYSSWIIRNKLLSEMIGKGMDPDSVTYNTLTNGFCKEGKVEEAFNLWDHISHRGLKLDEVAHTSLVHCLPQKNSASPSKALALPNPAPSSSVEAASPKLVDDGIMLKDTSSVPDSSPQPMNEPPSSQGIDPPIIEAEDTPMSPPVVATSSHSDKGKSSRMGESLVASLTEGAPSSTIVDETSSPAPSDRPATSSAEDLKFLKELVFDPGNKNDGCTESFAMRRCLNVDSCECCSCLWTLSEFGGCRYPFQ
ncbi:pentatricopeptide repeat-containing protein At1g64100-like [Olea europaea var. sylvestris]|uniref:pentatricopeptide repeat-containing protein At1g64100-like n=1 Tax=Olea europaea var. sylvestris TaxID=158386 RepID=UPI000C1CF7E5|nr:pentatricopeptide repeat-containing protein At1g64100-like [Olea europaea var. sylvestris]